MVYFTPLPRQEYLMKAVVQCPRCRHSLMDKKHPINGIPSISLYCNLPEDAVGQEGLIRLSSYYGDFTIKTTLVIKEETIGEFSCPICHSGLNSSRKCDLCDAPMVELQLERSGMLKFCLEAYRRRLPKEPSDIACSGILQFCARRGCRKHLIEFANQDADLKAFYEAYAPYFE